MSPGSTPTSGSDLSGSADSTALIAGVVIGSTAVLIFIILVGLVLMRKRRKMVEDTYNNAMGICTFRG